MLTLFAPSPALLTPTVASRAPAVSMRAATWKPGETAPAYLDGSMPADAGCDPLCLVALARPVGVVPKRIINGGFLDRILPFPYTTKGREKLMASRTADEQQQTVAFMREAEIKHCRLAMLAAVGWPMAELFNQLPFGGLGFIGGRAPALLNGGLDAYAPFMLLFLGAASYLEINTVDDVYQTYLYKQEKEYVPGNLEFDPLGLSDKLGRTAAAEAEIYNGRLAMLAITGFAMQEAVWGQPVVDQWSIFFKPAF